MIINWCIRTIAAVNANNRPGEVAAAAALGFTLAMIPAGNLLWVSLLAATFFLKINFGMEMVVIALFKPLSPFLDPVFDSAGYTLLTFPALESMFTSLYNMPVVPLTGFNNTVVAGSLVITAAAFYPMFLFFRMLVRLYRERVRDRFISLPVIKKISSLPLVSKAAGFYRKAMELRQS